MTYLILSESSCEYLHLIEIMSQRMLKIILIYRDNLLSVSHQSTCNLLIGACQFDPVSCPKPIENKTKQGESIHVNGKMSCINFIYQEKKFVKRKKMCKRQWFFVHVIDINTSFSIMFYFQWLACNIQTKIIIHILQIIKNRNKPN